MKQIPHYINGRAQAGTSNRFAEAYHPATGEVGSQVPLASAAHGNKPSWALASPSRPRAWAWASSWGALAL